MTAYSPTDLVNWTFEGEVMKVGQPGKLADADAWAGRMSVMYNGRTRTYVLLTQYGSKGGGDGIL